MGVSGREREREREEAGHDHVEGGRAPGAES